MSLADPPVGRGFLVAYGIAYLGAFVGVAPLLQILAPLRASLIAGPDKVAVYSLAMIGGCLAAGVGNVAAGVLSDRTVCRFGRRKPWILIGGLLTAACYGLILSATTPVALVAAMIGYQLAFNLMFSPLAALYADRVSEESRGP
ncbi:hypothetical protein LTR94_032105, partial [Friedmanniomyces endolithicus]